MAAFLSSEGTRSRSASKRSFKRKRETQRRTNAFRIDAPSSSISDFTCCTKFTSFSRFLASSSAVVVSISAFPFESSSLNSVSISLISFFCSSDSFILASTKSLCFSSSAMCSRAAAARCGCRSSSICDTLLLNDEIRVPNWSIFSAKRSFVRFIASSSYRRDLHAGTTRASSFLFTPFGSRGSSGPLTRPTSDASASDNIASFRNRGRAKNQLA
mmetsp:Transcript_18327/g.43445  ORF Transcript_18327/g.43445 Transcript_18327/m.43445 type:complete len:215 (+) Transcript_18327:572-1216(+)